MGKSPQSPLSRLRNELFEVSPSGGGLKGGGLKGLRYELSEVRTSMEGEMN